MANQRTNHDLSALRRVLWDLVQRAHRAITQLDGYMKAEPETGEAETADAPPRMSRVQGEPTRSPPSPVVIQPGMTAQTTVGPGHSRGVARALRHIELHFERPIAIGRLARIAGCSPSTLTRAFHREVGQSPHEYLVSIRLMRAASAMNTGDKIESAMLGAGFRSKRNFYRQFKAQFGRTPAHHRGTEKPT